MTFAILLVFKAVASLWFIPLISSWSHIHIIHSHYGSNQTTDYFITYQPGKQILNLNVTPQFRDPSLPPGVWPVLVRPLLPVDEETGGSDGRAWDLCWHSSVWSLFQAVCSVKSQVEELSNSKLWYSILSSLFNKKCWRPSFNLSQRISEIGVVSFHSLQSFLRWCREHLTQAADRREQRLRSVWVNRPSSTDRELVAGIDHLLLSFLLWRNTLPAFSVFISTSTPYS